VKTAGKSVPVSPFPYSEKEDSARSTSVHLADWIHLGPPASSDFVARMEEEMEEDGEGMEDDEGEEEDEGIKQGENFWGDVSRERSFS
jgi:hypothetical protein